MSDPANPADAAARFMQDMWKAFTPGAAGSPGAGAGAASGSTPSMPFMPTPEMVRSMQNAFLTSMEEAAERTMRTPQFLDAMRRGMEESLAMQQQLRAFMQQNLEQSMPAATGGGDVAAATVAALQRIERKLDRLEERLDAMEREPAATPGRRSGSAAGKDQTA